MIAEYVDYIKPNLYNVKLLFQYLKNFKLVSVLNTW